MNARPIFTDWESLAGQQTYRHTGPEKTNINGGYIMEIHQSTSQGVTIVALIGRLDTNSTLAFEENCRTWMARSIILDLSRLEYISSSGLRVFLQMKRDCANKNIPIVFAGSYGSVDRVIRVSGFENIFPRYPSVEDALQAVAVGSA
jgi:anti-sigma B factor antagonist